jgi:uncharacterized protein
MKWTKPNTITGSAAEGNKYFRRQDVEDKLWHEIMNYNHVLFLAPRRVGKSSIVMYMSLNNVGSFSSKYENIQSDSSTQDFYYRLCKMTYDALSTYGKTKNWLSKWWGRWTITSVGTDKIDIKNVDLDYRKEFFDLLKDIQQQKEKVVLFLDEFPDVIWNIYNKSGSQDAEALLNDVRELRQTKSFKDVFVMVLLGSVGLSHIVKKISGRVDKVNDLHKEYLYALKPNKAQEFLEYIIIGATMQIADDNKAYLLYKIGHHIPYYIQLIIEECDDLLYDAQRKDLTKEDIDKAYALLLKKHQHFEDWDDRLSKYFPDKYAYLLEILSTCAKHEKLSIQEIYNIARVHNNDREWKADVDDILIADGYLYEEEDTFCFNSPLLRDWWKSRHPLMNK